MQQPNANSLPVKATLLVVSTLTVMAGATIAPSLPAMRAHFAELPNVDFWVRLVLTVPALFIVIGAYLAGIIVDRFGRKPLLTIATALYGVAGSSGFILESLWHILIGRALLGFAVAGIMTTATTLIADYYVGSTRANFMGLQAAFMGLGGVLFLTSGGFLADINWRMPFLIYLFAFVILPFVAFALYEPQRSPSLEATAVSDSLGERPAEPIKVVSPPAQLLILIYGTAFLSQVIFYLIPVQLPFYLEAIAKANAAQSGLAIAFATLLSAFGSLAYGRVRARINFVNILTLIFGLMGLGYVIIGLVNSYAQVLGGLAIAGLGLGLLMPNLTVWLSATVPDAMRGRALGGLTTFFFLGQFLSPILTQPINQRLGLGITYSLAGGLLLLLMLVFLAARQQILTLTASSAKQER